MTKIPDDLEPLFQRTDWLQRLVPPLLGAAPEDIAHDACVAALERPPQRDTLAWLKQVVRNLAARSRRTELRRQRREAAVARSEATRATDEIAARLELETKLARAVLALEQPLQRAILLRYYENRPPRAIAAELRVPLATVKSWLHRALKKLRASLESDLGPAWRPALLSIGAPGAASTAVGGAIGAAVAGALLLAVWGWSTRSAERNTRPHHHDLLRNASALEEVVAPRLEDAAIERTSDASPAATSARKAPAETQEAAPADLLVEVVDHEGRIHREAEVQIVFSTQRDASSTINRPSRAFRTDNVEREGRIRIPGAEVARVLRQAQRDTDPSATHVRRELALSCDILGAEPVRCVLDPARLPSSPVRLQLPPVGAIRVEICDANGAAFQQICSVRLGDRRAPGIPDRRIRDGVAFYPCVALGCELRLIVEDAAESFAPVISHPRGPTIPGETTRLRVALTQPVPVVTGLLIDEHGRALAERRAWFRTKKERGGEGTLISTDGEGRFVVKWSARWHGAPIERFELILIGDGDPEDAPPIASHSVPALPVPATGSLDLGVLALLPPEPPPIVLAGIVRDEQGRPIAGAPIEVAAIWPLTLDGPWESFAGLGRILSDAEGAFSLRTSSPPRGLRLQPAVEGRYLVGDGLFEAGRRDVELRLRPGATLRGRVLLDPEVPPEEAILRLYHGQRQVAETTVQPSGAFELRGLAPGVARLEIGRPAWTCTSIADIAISGSGSIEEPRCAEIDLRGALRRWMVRLEGTRPLHGLDRLLRFVDPNDPQRIFSVMPSPGMRYAAWIPSAFDVVALVLRDHAPIRASWMASEQALRVVPGIELEVEVPEPEAISPLHELRVELKIAEDSALTALERHALHRRRVTCERGLAQLRAPVAGDYLLLWTLRAPIRDRTVTVLEQKLSISDSPLLQRLRIGPTPAELGRAAEELSR